MTSVPYPSFQRKNPVDLRNNRAALGAVGRCRINPNISGTSGSHYRDIVSKNLEQVRVEKDGAMGDKLKKKCMKEGVAMAKNYFIEHLQLDVSIVDVEVYVNADDIISTNGCLVACLLDAGCDKVVTDGLNLQALDVAKISSDRLVGHFTLDEFSLDHYTLMNHITTAAHYANTISIELTNRHDINEQKMMELVESFGKEMMRLSQSQVAGLHSSSIKLVLQFDPKNCEPKLQEKEELAAMVGFISKVGSTSISLIDPSATDLGLSWIACCRTDRPDGLYTTVVCARNGEALGLVYSSKESVVAALECGRGVYYSRSRNGLWRKGDTSGKFQVLHRIDVDCDGDALRFTVTQRGTGEHNDEKPAFCHLNTMTCWGKARGLLHLQETLKDRYKNAPEGSYTKRLFDDADLLRDKLVEEAQELSEANDRVHVAEELADVLYFAMVRATAAGVRMEDAVAELDKRARKVTRRKGDSKAFRIEAAKKILQKGGESESAGGDSPVKNMIPDSYSEAGYSTKYS